MFDIVGSEKEEKVNEISMSIEEKKKKARINGVCRSLWGGGYQT